MIDDVKKYESCKDAFVGVTQNISKLGSFEAWKDIFVFNDQCGRAHIVPCMIAGLSEVRNEEWIFRTPWGDFKPIASDPILELIYKGIREFAVELTDYNLEAQK